MSKFKKLNPAFLFIISVLFYWSSTANLFNPIALILLVLGVVLITKPIKALAVVIGVIFLIINLYLVLALLSEFREFPNITSKAVLMLGVGGAYIAFNIYISLRLIIYNLPSEDEAGQLS
jgi:hypothetical protein